MPVSTVLARGIVKLTNQQIADMMLSEDRLARSARARGDYAKARYHDAEVRRLAEALS